jgi:hypothetical protein
MHLNVSLRDSNREGNATIEILWSIIVGDGLKKWFKLYANVHNREATMHLIYQSLSNISQ